MCNTQVPGEADLWAGFRISELKPLIDAQYRTLTDRDHTFISGFSLGGLNSMYIGWDFDETFSRVGSFSGSIIAAPNFTARVMDEPWRDIRIYMDSGTVSKSSIYNSNRILYSNLIGKSPQKYVVEGDLRYFIAFGQDHQFVNAGTRLPNMMTFLYPATEEPSETTTPDDFNAFRGFLNSGTLDDVLVSDDVDLCHDLGITIFPSEAPITLDFDGTLPTDSPASLAVTFESSANTPGLELTISMWNYNTNSWDVVGTATQGFNVDAVRTFVGNPADHVEAGTGNVSTRYEVRQAGIIFQFPWTDCIDRVFWTTFG